MVEPGAGDHHLPSRTRNPWKPRPPQYRGFRVPRLPRHVVRRWALRGSL